LKNRAVPQNGDRARDFCEQTVIEFGTTREVLFRSSLLLGFGDRVHLKNSDGSFDAEGDVVAMQYHDGRMAVAVRFARDVANWIIKV
jgi:hypothetical protein